MHAIGDALRFAFGMTWEILWALILGFALSGAVQAVVSKQQMRRLLPDASPRTLTVAAGLGAASSSCSYASVALARSLFRKGADFTAAMAFEFASTNLVVELGIILAVLIGWQFTAGEFLGGPIMIALLALLFRRFLTPGMFDEARREADRGALGRMEGHAEMDMSVTEAGSLWRRLRSPQGLTSVSNYFVMDWAAVWMDIFGGLLIAGALAALVPNSFWQGLFLQHNGTLATVWGPLIGPLVAILSFVCSIGNVPLVGAANGIFFNHGQCCNAGSRLYVQSQVFDDVVAGVAEQAKNIKLAPGTDSEAQMGPLISDEQFEKVLGYLDSGRDEGAEAVVGGGRMGDRGYFVQPTVLTQTNPDMKVVREEIFGPVVCAIPFDSPEEIVPVANNTNYGLAAGVFTRDISEAHRIAKRLRAGTVWINTYHVFDAAMPFGGYKESGWGREMGSQVLNNYLETKSVVTAL